MYVYKHLSTGFYVETINTFAENVYFSRIAEHMCQNPSAIFVPDTTKNTHRDFTDGYTHAVFL